MNMFKKRFQKVRLEEEIFQKSYVDLIDIGNTRTFRSHVGNMIFGGRVWNLFSIRRHFANEVKHLRVPRITFVAGIDPLDSTKITIGWAIMSDKDIDEPSKAKGCAIARGRAIHNSKLERDGINIGQNHLMGGDMISSFEMISNELPSFLHRCKRFYKDRVLPDWAEVFDTYDRKEDLEAQILKYDEMVQEISSSSPRKYKVIDVDLCLSPGEINSILLTRIHDTEDKIDSISKNHQSEFESRIPEPIASSDVKIESGQTTTV